MFFRKVFVVAFLLVLAFFTAVGSSPKPMPMPVPIPMPMLSYSPPYVAKKCPNGRNIECPTNIVVEYESDISIPADIVSIVKDVGLVVTNLPSDVWIKDIHFLANNEAIEIQLKSPVEIDPSLPQKINEVVDIIEGNNELQGKRSSKSAILITDNFEDSVSSLNLETLVKFKFTLYSTSEEILPSPLEIVETIAFLLQEESEYRVGMLIPNGEFLEYGGKVEKLYSGCECLSATLNSFDIIPHEKHEVEVEWSTLSEFNNIGTNIWCAQMNGQNFQNFVKLNDVVIPSKSVETQGASYSSIYSWRDAKIKEGINHCVIENIDSAGECTLECDFINTVFNNGESLVNFNLEPQRERAIDLCLEYQIVARRLGYNKCLDDLLLIK